MTKHMMTLGFDITDKELAKRVTSEYRGGWWKPSGAAQGPGKGPGGTPAEPESPKRPQGPKSGPTHTR